MCGKVPLVVRRRADVAQSVEHSLGKGEVVGSIPIISSRFLCRLHWYEASKVSRAVLGDRDWVARSAGVTQW
jgi:hypothetical protein